jgi:hypothetical protein
LHFGFDTFQNQNVKFPNTLFSGFLPENRRIRLFTYKISKSTYFQAKNLKKGANLLDPCILLSQSTKNKMSSLSKHTFFRFFAWKTIESIIYR